MTEHAVYSPSSADRMIACPASHGLERSYPDIPNEFSIQGTHDHSLLNKCFLEDCGPLVYVNQVLSDEDGDFTVDNAQAQRIDQTLEYVKQRVDSHSNVTVYSEKRVDLQGLLDEPDNYDVWGTCDILLVGDDFFEVIDYKGGFKAVSPKTAQLKLYALGALSSIPNLPARVGDDVVMTIVQPRLKDQGMAMVNSHTMTQAELHKWFDSVYQPAVRSTHDRHPPYSAGPHCRYCKHGAVCSIRATTTLEQCNVIFDKDTLMRQTNELDVYKLTDDELLSVFEAIPMLESFFKDVKELLSKRWLQNNPLPGTKAIKGRGAKKWSMSDEEIAKVLKGMGVPKSAIYPSKLISPAQALTLSWTKKNKAEHCTFTPRQIEKIKDNLITYEPGKPQIVLENDVREALPVYADLFDDTDKASTPPDWLKKRD